MADIVDKITRSRMMAGIKSKNTLPERALRSALHGLGFRFRLHAAGLPGRPDLVLRKFGAAIQVHGCFWHRHKGCPNCTCPASNRAFWDKKFSQTVARDRVNLGRLLESGWRVAVIWECVLGEITIDDSAATISKWLKGSDSYLELPKAKGIRRNLKGRS